MTHVCVHLQQSFRSPLSAPPGLCTHRTRCMLACRLWLPSAPACTRSSLTLQSPSHAVMSLSRFACRKALITTGANALSCFCVFKLALALSCGFRAHGARIPCAPRCLAFGYIWGRWTGALLTLPNSSKSKYASLRALHCSLRNSSVVTFSLYVECIWNK